MYRYIMFTISIVFALVTSSDRCGPQFNNTICSEGLYCSDWGYCGDTPAHRIANYGRCGSQFGDKTCNPEEGEGECCSEYGWCGSTPEHCTQQKLKTVTHCINNKHITFTFDDGPTEISIDALQKGEELGIPITFFHVGDFMYGNFDKLNTIVSSSIATLSSHSFRHIAYNSLSRGDQEIDLLNNENLVYSVTGVKPRLFRPPYGLYDSDTEEILLENDYINVLWSLDSVDWLVTSQGLDSIEGFNNIVNDFQNDMDRGHIILCHDLNSVCVEQMENIYNYFTTRGYTFVDMETCIGENPYKQL